MEEIKDKEFNIENSIGVVVTRELGSVVIETGKNDAGDFIMHFSPRYRQRPFPADLTIIYRIIATYMSKIIPESVKVDIYPPPDTWEKKLITVVARGYANTWNFDDERIEEQLKHVANHITQELDRQKQKVNK